MGSGLSPASKKNTRRGFALTRWKSRRAVGPTYPGTFETYTASVIAQWMAERKDSITALNADLRFLGLSGGVLAIPVNGVQIELHVGRLPDVPPIRPEDRVNIADVGVGV